MVFLNLTPIFEAHPAEVAPPPRRPAASPRATKKSNFYEKHRIYCSLRAVQGGTRVLVFLAFLKSKIFLLAFFSAGAEVVPYWSVP